MIEIAASALALIVVVCEIWACAELIYDYFVTYHTEQQCQRCGEFRKSGAECACGLTLTNKQNAN